MNETKPMKLRGPDRATLVKAAREKYQEEGRIEIDDCANISEGDTPEDEGCYVQAWVWVNYEEDISE